MSEKKPKILVVAKSEKVYQTLENNLRMAFGTNVQIVGTHESYTLPEAEFNRADLIVVSGSPLLDKLPKIKHTIPVLVARRMVNLAKLEPLMEVAPGTQCLFVSNDLETAEDSIELLHRLGFDHLNFLPYVPYREVKPPNLNNIRVVVTHGWAEMTPKGIDKVIDLGNRSLDLSTLFEIARYLKLSVEKAQFYTAEFFRDFVRVGRKLSNTMNNEKWLNQKLEAILNAVHEGIIAVDAAGKITVFNEEAEKILNLSAAYCLGRSHQEIIPDFTVYDLFESHLEVNNQVIETRNLFLLVTKIPMVLDGNFLGVVVTFQDITKVQRIEQEFRKNATQLGLITKYSFASIIGKSLAITETKQAAKKLAASDYTVLISGENGTGKEVFAQAIHHHSNRLGGPFVPVNFAGLTESLAESELFGYEEGSFTGARKGGKMGLFELAHNGTIFLDEIGDAPPSIQAALLRVLQEKQVMRVGGNRVIPINVRVIAATNRDLMEMVRSGKFREDLYYRLNVLPLQIPSLRERREDLFILIDSFLKDNRRTLDFSPRVREVLEKYNWPGNVRELENFINYLMVIVDDSKVEMRHIPEMMISYCQQNTLNNRDTPLYLVPPSHDEEVKETVDYLKRQGIIDDFRDILESLLICSKRQERVGRGALTTMLSRPLSESQIRQKLEILNRSGSIIVGVKKQGTQITAQGIRVLAKLKEHSS